MAQTPDLVLKADEEAERLHKEMYQAPEQPEPVETPNEPTEPAQEVEQPVDETDEQTEVQQAPQKESTTEAKSTEKPEDYKQKWNTLRGIVRSDRERHELEVRELRAKIASLEQAQQAKQPESTTTQPTAIFTQEEIDTYGEDFLNLVERVSDVKARAYVEQMNPVINQTAQQVEQVAATTAAERYLNKFTEILPNWREINDSQEWREWLAVEDPIIGATRQAALTHANQTLDLNRTKAIFDAFLSQTGYKGKDTKPAGSIPQGLSPSPRTVGNSTARPTNTAPRPLTPEQITEHYSRATRDRRYADSTDYQAMEKRIAEFMKSGG